MKTCISALIICISLIIGRQAIADDTRLVTIHGRLMNGCFGVSSDYKGPSLLKPDSRWSNFDRYYLQIDGPKGPIYGRISVERGENPVRSPNEELKYRLNDLRQPYKNPAGRVTKIVNTGARIVPILTFSGTGGNMTLATIYLENRYIVEIVFSEDLPLHYASKSGFTNLTEKVAASFSVIP